MNESNLTAHDGYNTVFGQFVNEVYILSRARQARSVASCLSKSPEIIRKYGGKTGRSNMRITYPRKINLPALAYNLRRAYETPPAQRRPLKGTEDNPEVRAALFQSFRGVDFVRLAQTSDFIIVEGDDLSAWAGGLPRNDLLPGYLFLINQDGTEIDLTAEGAVGAGRRLILSLRKTLVEELRRAALERFVGVPPIFKCLSPEEVREVIAIIDSQRGKVNVEALRKARQAEYLRVEEELFIFASSRSNAPPAYEDIDVRGYLPAAAFAALGERQTVICWALQKARYLHRLSDDFFRIDRVPAGDEKIVTGEVDRAAMDEIQAANEKMWKKGPASVVYLGKIAALLLRGKSGPVSLLYETRRVLFGSLFEFGVADAMAVDPGIQRRYLEMSEFLSPREGLLHFWALFNKDNGLHPFRGDLLSIQRRLSQALYAFFACLRMGVSETIDFQNLLYLAKNEAQRIDREVGVSALTPAEIEVIADILAVYVIANSELTGEDIRFARARALELYSKLPVPAKRKIALLNAKGNLQLDANP